MKEKPITGILWWKPKQWEKAKQISLDKNDFDNTYQEWKERAEKTFKSLRELGISIHKIEIDLDELVKWCKEQSVPLNAKARSRFVSIKVQKHQESRSKNKK